MFRAVFVLPALRVTAVWKGSPARGCGVERRLRRIQRDGAGAAVAERKCASAHAARCGHRKPDAGCAARRRLRGALPPCGGDILQNLPETCPASVGDDACNVPEPCHAANPMRRAKSPALHCGRERAAADERLLSVKPAGGPMKSSAPTPGRATACHLRRCCAPALHCRAGVYARRKGLRRPEGYW